MACFYTYIDSAEIEAEFKKKVNHEEEGDRRQPQKTEGKMVKCDSNAMLNWYKQTEMWSLKGRLDVNKGFISKHVNLIDVFSPK